MEDVDDLPLEKLYENFSQSKNSEDIVRSFQVLKSRLNLNSLHGLDLYKALREKLATHWKARDVFQLLEKRANQKEYLQQTAAKGVRVFIVGAGPIGLRQAIECILLGAEVTVVEKRSSFSRNNVLHLWPCTTEDLRQLGAKKFYGKFCAGAIDHINIRSLQCILLKVCLLLGVTIHSGVEFQEILEPDETRGWHAKVSPEDHEAADFDFNVLVGADGCRSTIPGFDRRELRGKLALTITVNFENCFTREEAAVDEISGVAFIFNQKFFKDLKEDTDIDLENIVYYKDDTHYFFMTAKKDSLLKKGVLKDDYRDTRELLKSSNIDMDELYEYVTDAAEWSTDLQLNNIAMNHNGSPDVALFDFTSIYQAEYASRAINRKGKDLLLCVVGDALLEPFWPTGTSYPRGFLSVMDTAWLIRGLGQKRKMLDLLRERESIFQLLPQTTPERLHTNIKAYTIDPQTRYPNLKYHVKTETIKKLYDIKSGSDEELHEGVPEHDSRQEDVDVHEKEKGVPVKTVNLLMGLPPSRSWSQVEPSEGTGQLAVIEEKKEEEGGRLSPSSPRRPRSPSQWRGPIVNRPPEEVKYLPRSSAKLKRSQWKRHGTKSVTRPLIGTFDASNVAIQERRWQQQRFHDAQLIQHEIGQLERQHEELEEVGRQIEQHLMDAEDTSQEDQLMKSWLSERNSLTRKISEFNMRMKGLELKDRQYEVDKELNELFAISEQTAEQVAQFDELCEMKIKIVEERNELVIRIAEEEERIRELEEDEALSLRLDERFGSSYDITPEVELEEYDVSKLSKELNQLCAIPGELSHCTHRASKPEEPVEAILHTKRGNQESSPGSLESNY